MQQWVWTTFNRSYRELSDSNPAILRAMPEENFVLARSGVDLLGLDTIVFI